VALLGAVGLLVIVVWQLMARHGHAVDPNVAGCAFWTISLTLLIVLAYVLRERTEDALISKPTRHYCGMQDRMLAMMVIPTVLAIGTVVACRLSDAIGLSPF